jgi:4-hydroxybenzoate polyprenyltransferase
MNAWLQLIRWPNLILVALAQILFKYAFLPAFDIPAQLGKIDFALLCLAIVFVTAAGNIINDIFDINTDFVNRRSRPLAQQTISVANAYVLYFTLNLLALFLVRHIGFRYQVLDLIVVVFGVIILLYLYAKYLKKMPLLGNIVVSTLVSTSFVLVIYIEAFALSDQTISDAACYWVIGYAVFAFWANLNREWIKDIQDIKGDYAQGISTLPILLGKSRMNMLIFASTLALVLSLIAGVKVYFQPDLIFILYLTFGICVPLIYVLYHIHRKELNTNYKMLSHLYKLVMLMGIISLIFFKL